MERVTFLVERTGERIPCLLNPERLEVRRSAGIVRRRSAGGAVIGNPRTDDPLVATGGGVTEYELKLLFDVDLMPGQSESGTIAPIAAPTPMPSGPGEGGFAALAEGEAQPAGEADPGGDQAATDAAEAIPEAEATADTLPVASPAPPASIDVRTLTQPLWALAENGQPVAGSLAPQRVRFVWGRSWNIPGVILAVAERLECFDEQGVPKRSWLSLLMRRVEEQLDSGSAPPAPTSPQFEVSPPDSGSDATGDDSVVLPVAEDGTPLTPLYLVAHDTYGDSFCDRAIAEYNDIDDPLELEPGRAIRLPRLSAIAGTA